jgi:hypothetical protein
MLPGQRDQVGVPEQLVEPPNPILALGLGGNRQTRQLGSRFRPSVHLLSVDTTRLQFVNDAACVQVIGNSEEDSAQHGKILRSEKALFFVVEYTLVRTDAG